MLELITEQSCSIFEELAQDYEEEFSKEAHLLQNNLMQEPQTHEKRVAALDFLPSHHLIH